MSNSSKRSFFDRLRRRDRDLPNGTRPFELHLPSRDYPEEPWSIDVLFLNACIRRRVRFYCFPTSNILCPLQDLEGVLNEISDVIRVIGFEAFELEGYSIIPRSDYIATNDPAVTVAEALEYIRDWPRNENLWIQPFLTSTTTTRPLSFNERTALLNILAVVPGPRGDILRQQVEFASVTDDEWWPTSIGLAVGPGAAPMTEEVRGPLEAEADVFDELGEPIGGIWIWLNSNGFLSAIEYFWYPEDRPTTFPHPNQLRVRHRPRDMAEFSGQNSESS